MTMALVSGNGLSSVANPSQISFALSSLVSVTEEQMEALGDDELALVINRFSRFHINRMNHWCSGGLIVSRDVPERRKQDRTRPVRYDLTCLVSGPTLTP